MDDIRHGPIMDAIFHFTLDGDEYEDDCNEYIDAPPEVSSTAFSTAMLLAA